MAVAKAEECSVTPLQFLAENSWVIWVIFFVIVLVLIAVVLTIALSVNRVCSMIESVCGGLKDAAKSCVNKICNTLKDRILPILQELNTLKGHSQPNSNAQKLGEGSDNNGKK